MSSKTYSFPPTLPITGHARVSVLQEQMHDYLTGARKSLDALVSYYTTRFLLFHRDALATHMLRCAYLRAPEEGRWPCAPEGGAGIFMVLVPQDSADFAHATVYMDRERFPRQQFIPEREVMEAIARAVR